MFLTPVESLLLICLHRVVCDEAHATRVIATPDSMSCDLTSPEVQPLIKSGDYIFLCTLRPLAFGKYAKDSPY